MKCVQCERDAKYKDRANGKCPGCGHPFAFEPQKGDPITDMALKKAMDRVGSSGKVRWTVDHLYQELRRPPRGIARILIPGLIGLGLLLAAVVLPFKSLFVLLIAAVGVVFCLVAVRRRFPQNRFNRSAVEALLQRWSDVHGSPSSLLINRQLPPAPSRALEEELSAYSFDRAVICDRHAIVDVLLANQFHFENNCAVLCDDGYPENTFPIIMRMLRKNPKLNVFVLHDASPRGCMLAHKLRTSPEWFAGIGQVIDVGLRPAHARFFPGMAEKNPVPLKITPTHGIDAAEAKWLSRWRLEMTVVRPEQLIKRLYRAMTGVEQGGWGAGTGNGGSTGGADVIYFGTDADTSDGGGDSFG